MNNKFKKRYLFGVAFFLVFALSGCGVKNRDENRDNGSGIQNQPEQTSDPNVSGNQERMEFQDPGNEEVGQDIKEIDSLINSTQSAYDENELSEEALDMGAERQ